MEKPELIYVYDALCGWCFGFSPVITSIHEKHAGSLDFSVVSGGLITGDRVGPIAPMAAYIKKAVPHLEKTTGVKMGEGFMKRLDDGTQIQNSLPPAIALAVFRSYKPEMSVPFAAGLQQANFVENADLNSIDFYREFAGRFGLDGNEFAAKMSDASFIALAEADFAKATAFGVTGFPAVIIRKADKYYLVSSGYADLEMMEQRITAVLSDGTGK